MEEGNVAVTTVVVVVGILVVRDRKKCWAHSSAWIEWLPAEQLVEGSSPSGPAFLFLLLSSHYERLLLLPMMMKVIVRSVVELLLFGLVEPAIW